MHRFGIAHRFSSTISVHLNKCLYFIELNNRCSISIVYILAINHSAYSYRNRLRYWCGCIPFVWFIFTREDVEITTEKVEGWNKVAKTDKIDDVDDVDCLLFGGKPLFLQSDFQLMWRQLNSMVYIRICSQLGAAKSRY